MNLQRLFAPSVATLIFLGSATVTLKAAEIRVIGATPMAAVVTQVGKQFERETGHVVRARFFSGPVVKREIDSGEPFDLAISITPVVDALVKEAKLDADTRVAVAYAGVGIGVRAGAPKPEISTVDSFRTALLQATSVAHSAEGASGEYFTGLLKQLGIAEQMKPKLRPMSPDLLAKAVPSGQAEMIVVTMSVIVAGAAELVGPVPKEVQFYNSFAGGIGAKAQQSNAARSLLNALTSPTAAKIITDAGMSPGKP